MEFFDLQRQVLWNQFKDVVQTCNSDVEGYFRLISVGRELMKLDFEIMGQIMSLLAERTKPIGVSKKRKRSKSKIEEVKIEQQPVEVKIEQQPVEISMPVL
jgi:hypothetical protein